MSSRMTGKICIDLAMTILLLFLMARQITGDSAHEWLGAVMFILWVVHHILNFQWYRHLFRGKYAPFRIFQTVINFLLLLAMAGTMVSAVILSREVFAFLPIAGSIALARPLHVFCAFWSFVLMSLHLGLHWNMILGILQKADGPGTTKAFRAGIRTVGLAVAVYGGYAFVKNQIFRYLFLVSSYVFFDFERPLPLFFTEYLAIMGLFIFLAHYGRKLCARKVRK